MLFSASKSDLLISWSIERVWRIVVTAKKRKSWRAPVIWRPRVKTEGQRSHRSISKPQSRTEGSWDTVLQRTNNHNTVIWKRAKVYDSVRQLSSCFLNDLTDSSGAESQLKNPLWCGIWHRSTATHQKKQKKRLFKKKKDSKNRSILCCPAKADETLHHAPDDIAADRLTVELMLLALFLTVRCRSRATVSHSLHVFSSKSPGGNEKSQRFQMCACDPLFSEAVTFRSCMYRAVKREKKKRKKIRKRKNSTAPHWFSFGRRRSKQADMTDCHQGCVRGLGIQRGLSSRSTNQVTAAYAKPITCECSSAAVNVLSDWKIMNHNLQSSQPAWNKKLPEQTA